MSSIPRAVLSEQFQEWVQGRRLTAAVFLTFRFDPGFFEQEVLPVFLDVPLSHEPAVRLVQLDDAIRAGVDHLAVYYDPRGLAAGAQSSKLDVQRIPVAWPTGFFHPKNVLLLVEDAEPQDGGGRRQQLLVAALSANLTRAGWWENVEVCHVEELSLGAKSRLRNDLLKLISRVKRACPPDTDHSALEAIRRFVVKVPERHRHTAEGVLHTRLYVGESDGGGAKESVPEFLRRLLWNKKPLNLEVISPYFDDTAGAAPLRALLETLDLREVRVHLPTGPDGAALCKKEFFEAVRRLPHTSWGSLPRDLLKRGRDDQAAPRFVHAKVYRFFHPGERYEALFVGSVNLTHAAHAKGGNFETALLVEPDVQGKPDWWLSVESKKPREFTAQAAEEPLGEDSGRRLRVRYSWRTKRAEVWWDGRERSPRLHVAALDVALFSLDPLPPAEWCRRDEADAAALERVLKSTSFLTVTAEGEGPATILVLEEGLAQKPSLLMNLTVSDILRCWAALSAEQKSVLLEERYAELGGTMSALLPRTPLGRTAAASFFDVFAGAFHAFASLERRVHRALDNGRGTEAVYLLFGQKYDSLPRLLQRLLNEEKQLDAVNRYVLLLCARQVLDRLASDAPGFCAAHRGELHDLERHLAALAEVRGSLALGGETDKAAFLDWYETWFLKRAEPMTPEQAP